VARLAYEATEQDLEREFGRFGPIERVSLSSLPTHCTRLSLNDPTLTRFTPRFVLSLILIKMKNPKRRRRSIVAMLSWYLKEKKI
jgi:hypothetical protein